MLQIRLSTVPPTEAGGVAKPVTYDNVTVACPDHLILADLPVAKGIGAPTAATVVKSVGRRSRRLLGERVHFCIRCDFPIAIYGRLSPCDHAFCLDCSRSDSICYLCDERIQKIQTIKMMEGIYVCAAPHCLTSFLKRADFEAHIHNTHPDLLQPVADREDGNEQEALSTKQPTASDSTVRPNSRHGFSPGSIPQLHDREDKAFRHQQPPRPIIQQHQPQQQPPFIAQMQKYPNESQVDSNAPPGFDRPAQPNRFQQSFDPHATPQESTEPYSEYPPPMNSTQPPNYAVPMNNQNQVLPHPYNVHPYQTEGSQLPFYGAPYEMARPDSEHEAGSDQGSLLGFPPGSSGGSMNFPPGYSQPWNGGMPQSFEAPPPTGQTTPDGFITNSNQDSHGKGGYYQGDYRQSPGGVQMTGPPPPSGINNNMDMRDGQGILAPQNMQFQHQRPPHHMQPYKRAKYYSGDQMNHEGQGYGGWQPENRDGFRNNQE
ncbi:hypothetical protein ACFE04_003147 [Oxalis oulophora]